MHKSNFDSFVKLLRLDTPGSDRMVVRSSLLDSDWCHNVWWYPKSVVDWIWPLTWSVRQSGPTRSKQWHSRKFRGSSSFLVLSLSLVQISRAKGGKSNHGNATACDNLAFDRSSVVFSFSSRGVVDSLQEKKKAMRGAAKGEASEELERRSQYLSSLIRRTRISKEGDQVKKEVVKAEVKPMRREGQRKQEGDEEEEEEKKQKGAREVDQCDGNPPLEQQHQKTPIVKVRAADMPVALQKRAFRCAYEMLASMPKLESKRLAFALKKASNFLSECVCVCVCVSVSLSFCFSLSIIEI